jgi:Tfp pilus assembly protein PilF
MTRFRALAILAALLGVACERKTMSMPELYLTQRMATVLLQQGNAAEAESAFRKVLTQDPENAEMRGGHGVSLVMLGRAKEAEDELNYALKLSPNRGIFLNNRGAARLELGNYAGAEEDFLKAYESPLMSDRETSLINLGHARYRRGLFSDAEDAMTRALALNGTSFDAYMGRAQARAAKKDSAGALSDYLSALKIRPEDRPAMLHAGLTLLEMKNFDLGRKYLKHICESAPDSPEAERARLVLGEESSLPLSRP